MQAPRKDRDVSLQRTLGSLQSDHAKFIKSGAKIKHQSNFHNAIHEAIINIPVNNWCVPYLHIMLGIVKKHHDLLELDCHSLDLEIAKDIARRDTGLSNTLYDQFVEGIRTKYELERKIAELKNKCEDLEDNCSLATLASGKGKLKRTQLQLEGKRKELDSLCASVKLPDGAGPVATNLDNVLQTHNIQRQKYHGKSFVGNDCNKYLCPKVYGDVCKNIVVKTKNFPQCCSR